MHRTLLCITFVLSYDFISAVDEDDRKQDHCLHAATQSIKESLLDPITKGFDDLNGKLQEINEEVKIQKATIEEMKGSLNAAEKIDVGEVKQNIESFHQKQLKDQKAVMLSLDSYANVLAEIKNIAVEQFERVFEKAAIISDVHRSLANVSVGIANLKGAYTKQERKLKNVSDTLKQATDSTNRVVSNNTKRVDTMQEDLLKVLDEQSKPLSNEALSHVNKMANIAKTISSEIKRFDDLGPKLLQLYRLSENLHKEIPDNTLLTNMTESLEALKNSVPSILSSVSKSVGNLTDALEDLKALSKDNNCPADLTLEIRDHHNEVMKYLNGTIISRKEEQDENWNKVMKNLENIERSNSASSNINERLIKLREQINAIRELLQENLEDSDAKDEKVFG